MAYAIFCVSVFLAVRDCFARLWFLILLWWVVCLMVCVSFYY